MLKQLIFSLVLGGALLLAAPAYGSYANPCQPIYGGGQNCVTEGKIELNKQVQDPKSKKFVDNLTRNDSRYSASSQVTFKLIVTNTGDNVLEEITVTDTFPEFTSFVSGPGSFDPNTNTLTFKVFNLNPDESRTYTVVGKTIEVGLLPKDSGMSCVINAAIAQTGDMKSSDNAGFCIEKQGLTKGGLPVMEAPKVDQTPATGPEMLPLLGMIPAGLAGLFLRKKSSK